MAKRTFVKDSPVLRAKVKKGTVLKSQLKGAALTYYNRFHGAAKARKAKIENRAQVGEVTIPKDSDLYKIIEAAAKSKGMTVKEFIKKHKSSIEQLLKDGDIIIDRETDYLIKDLSSVRKDKKIFVNDQNGYIRIKKENAIYGLQQLKMHAAATTDIFIILYRVRFKVSGDVYFYLPPNEEYTDLFGEELEEFLDSYYPDITYVKSDKKSEQ